MSAFDAIGKAVAQANLSVAKGIGTTISFSHRGASAVTLNVLIVGDGNEPVIDGNIITERRFLKVQIATGQTGFTAASTDTEPITPGDKATYLSRAYFAAEPIEKDVYGRTYTVKFVEMKGLVS